MNQLNTIRQERQILERHKTDIAANRNFHYEVEETNETSLDFPKEANKAELLNLYEP
jgi:hypothetical protein